MSQKQHKKLRKFAKTYNRPIELLKKTYTTLNTDTKRVFNWNLNGSLKG